MPLWAEYREGMKRGFAFCGLVALALVAGCSRVAAPSDGVLVEVTPPEVVPVPRPEAGVARVVRPPKGARTAAAFDTTTAAQKAEALTAPSGGAELGKVVVSLGNPAEPGFWLKSALVSAKAAGVVKLANGKTAQVDLLPLTGGGPQLSLAAYRALELPLTALPEVTVLRP